MPAVLLSAWLLSACFGPRQRLREDSKPSPLADGFELTLNNRHWLDVNVFIQHDGESSRVTLVTASSSQSLILPLWMLGDSKLGQSVEVNVESTLSRSNYSIQ
jgi:hypothetical protein